MHRAIYIDSVPGEVRAALVEDGLLAEVLIERSEARGIAGNIYLARVRNLVPGLQAAFVDLGLDRDGFLHVQDAGAAGDDRMPGFDAAIHENHAGPAEAPRHPPISPRIEDCLREGQEIMVQVIKEPIGQKGPRVTAHLSLPGRLLVLLPGVEHIGVSRRIEDAGERERLRVLVARLAAQLESPGGFIVRTSGSTQDAEEFLPDARALLQTWDSIRTLRGRSKAPALLHVEAGAVPRALREWLCGEVQEVVLDAPHLMEEAIGFVKRSRPSLASLVRAHEGSESLYEARGLEAQIDRALRSKIWLKSGGFIVVNHTEALVAIDVNTGKYLGRERLEETILRTNLEAVQEIVRQIRLRDLGGIIVIDLIDMEEPASRSSVLAALDQGLRKDRARSRVLPISEFGLVEITRQRTRPGVDGVLCRPCPGCGGSGRIKSIDTLGFEIIREARKQRASAREGKVVVRVHPEAGARLREQRTVLTASAGLSEERLLLEEDAGLRPDQWILCVI